MTSTSRARFLFACVALLGAASRISGSPSCEPRPINDWRLRCATDRDEIEDSLAAVRKSESFPGVESVGEACRVLAGSGGPCAAARAELLGVLLNMGAGRLNPDCCVQAGDAVKAVHELAASADRCLAGGCTAEQCELIGRGLRGVNDGSRLTDCSDGASPRPAAQVEPTSRLEPVEGPDAAGLVIRPNADASTVFVPDATPTEPPPAGTCCDPRTADAWARACTLGAGKWSALTESLASDNERDFGVTTCAGLGSIDIDEREEAKRQLIALRLNVHSGYLSPSCRLTSGETVEHAAQRAFELRRTGSSAAARDVAAGLNDGTLLVTQPCARPQEGLTLAWAPPPPPPETLEAEPSRPEPVRTDSGRRKRRR